MRSATVLEDNLQPLSPKEKRQQTGRYAGGLTVLVITLLVLHHVFIKGASTVTGLCVPAIIMAIYILWVLYTVRRDRQKLPKCVEECNMAQGWQNTPQMIGIEILNRRNNY